MGKLIDAEVLKKHYAWWKDDDEYKHIFNAIVDTQEEDVVRCKDCVYWGTKWKMKTPLVEYGDCLHLKGTSVKSDFFCAWGERREDGASR